MPNCLAYFPAPPAPHANSHHTQSPLSRSHCHQHHMNPVKAGNRGHHVINITRTHTLHHFTCSNHASKSTSKLSNPSYNHPSLQIPLAMPKSLNSCCTSHRKGLPNRATGWGDFVSISHKIHLSTSPNPQPARAPYIPINSSNKVRRFCFPYFLSRAFQIFVANRNSHRIELLLLVEPLRQFFSSFLHTDRYYE